MERLMALVRAQSGTNMLIHPVAYLENLDAPLSYLRLSSSRTPALGPRHHINPLVTIQMRSVFLLPRCFVDVRRPGLGASTLVGEGRGGGRLNALGINRRVSCLDLLLYEYCLVDIAIYMTRRGMLNICSNKWLALFHFSAIVVGCAC